MDRYSRQTAFAGVGSEGQKRIQAASAVVVGCGALGSVAAEMLARAGVGRLRLVDRDVLELHNLQRQSLFTEEDVRLALPKAEAARRRLVEINSSIEVEAVVADLNASTADALLDGMDIALDGADNFEARFLLNEACVRDGRPWVYAACLGAYAVSAGIAPGETACLRCFLEEAPPTGGIDTCDTAGILAPAVHAAAGMEVATALRLLVSGEGAGRMVSLDLWGGPVGKVDLGAPGPACPVCADGVYDYLEGRKGGTETVLCGRDAVQIRPDRAVTVDLESLEERLRPLGKVERNPYLLRFHESGGCEIVCFADGRCLVTGTQDPVEAKTLHARYLGA
jgi:adenylyltransferase/sulfurtransferase